MDTVSNSVRNFKVVCRSETQDSGFWYLDIYKEVKTTKQYNTSNVSTVFLQVRGNDIENLLLDYDIKRIFEEINDRLILTGSLKDCQTIQQVLDRSHLLSSILTIFCVYSLFDIIWQDCIKKGIYYDNHHWKVYVELKEINIWKTKVNIMIICGFTPM